MSDKDEQLAHTIVLNEIKPKMEKLAESGYAELIQHNRDNNKDVDASFLDMLEKSEFFKGIYQEGIVKGIFSYQEIRGNIAFLKG